MYERLDQASSVGNRGFLGARLAALSDVSSGTVVVLGAPFDATSNGRLGARFGPRAIRDASQYAGDLFASGEGGIVDLASGYEFQRPAAGLLLDLGDLALHPNDPERMLGDVREGVSEVVSRGAFPITLGGDHFVSYAAFSGFSEVLADPVKGGRLGLIHMSSHFDLGNVDVSGGRSWHGATARRILELPTTNHQNVVWVGVNGYVPSMEYDYAKEMGLSYFTSEDVRDLGLAEVTRRAVATASADTDAIYLSLSIDVVDSLFAPGVGTSTWGGITSTDLLGAMDLIGRANVRGADVVDVVPNMDLSAVTARIAALSVLRLVAPRILMKP